MQNIPVVIVGAGPVGLSMALALSRQNIRSLVLERHAGLTQHPRARGVNVRTMELFKQWGNDIELRQYEQPPEGLLCTFEVFCDKLVPTSRGKLEQICLNFYLFTTKTVFDSLMTSP